MHALCEFLYIVVFFSWSCVLGHACPWPPTHAMKSTCLGWETICYSPSLVLLLGFLGILRVSAAYLLK